MSNKESDELLDSQKFEIKKAIAEAGFAVSEFTFASVDSFKMHYLNVPVVSHEKTGSAFAFDIETNEFGDRRQRYSVRRPGRESAMETIQAQSWSEQMNQVREWLLLIKRELDPGSFRLGAIQASPVRESPGPIDSGAVRNRDIFLVHGHDEAAKVTVARFLEKLNVNPIILHEQADKGRTIIQKLEDHSKVRFAVVLLTPDDEGRGRGSDLKPRARQNVILELGYFIGSLGRERVCALKVDGVEEPSDLQGLLYVPFDSAGSWRLTLGRELKVAGIEVDMNRAL